MSQYLRKECANYISLKNKDFSPVIEVDGLTIEEYLSNLRKEGTWAGEIELASLSQITGYDIEVYDSKSFEQISLYQSDISSSSSVLPVFKAKQENSRSSEQEPLKLLFSYYGHYEILIKATDIAVSKL